MRLVAVGAWILTGGCLAFAALGDDSVAHDPAAFDHYTLALTWHPGFCATQSRPPDECRDVEASKQQGFVLHGLWPSLPKRFAERGIDRERWWRDGCFIDDDRLGGGFCAHPEPSLPAPLADDVADVMPGQASCLDHYQYAKHAACLALPETDYFALSVDLLERVNASAFVDFVVINRGGEVAIDELMTAFEAAFGEGTRQALHLACRGRGNRILSEVRIGIEAERIEAFPAPDSLAPQPPGECSPRIRIESL
ncbi:ribonuclease T2 family protein [Aidingimonas lacisalsi]|uniref:ribonuclease T2 family protein n=1 Tax=Aidingimonas lacisalsi TaxID=2604086 RepID=UPI0011D22190|nr:ribonuclease I [Aidingimonas lacisalsi]